MPPGGGWFPRFDFGDVGRWLSLAGTLARVSVLAVLMGLVLIIGPTLAARLIGVAPAPWRIGAFALLVFGLTIEFLVWTIGLGAALMTGLGRWHTVPPSILVEPNPPSQSNVSVAY